MSRFTYFFAANAKLLAANAIAAAGLGAAAIALSPSAAAEPIIPPVPNVPGLNMIQQLATNPAGVGAVLQTAASAISGAGSIIGGPAASTLPVSPIDVTGTAPAAIPSAPAASAVPPMVPSGTLGQTVLPLLNQFGIPGNLAGLAPSNVPFPIQIAQPGATAPTAPAAPLTAPLTAPAAATPQVGLTPAAGGSGLNPLPLLNALP